jgi:hypothetical protein
MVLPFSTLCKLGHPQGCCEEGEGGHLTSWMYQGLRCCMWCCLVGRCNISSHPCLG